MKFSDALEGFYLAFKPIIIIGGGAAIALGMYISVPILKKLIFAGH